MAKTHPHITDAIRAFIERQHLFFVASAPLSGEGHVNLSPKGLDCFRVLGPDRVAYLDVIGSGNETSAHLLENGRITFMFCAFDGPPNIVRLYGRGQVVLPGAKGWDELAAGVTVPSAARQFIVADITRVQTSCGFGVPLFDLKGHREHMAEWAKKKGPDGLAAYKIEHNGASLDGLPTHLSAVGHG